MADGERMNRELILHRMLAYDRISMRYNLPIVNGQLLVEQKIIDRIIKFTLNVIQNQIQAELDDELETQPNLTHNLLWCTLAAVHQEVMLQLNISFDDDESNYGPQFDMELDDYVSTYNVNYYQYLEYIVTTLYLQVYVDAMNRIRYLRADGIPIDSVVIKKDMLQPHTAVVDCYLSTMPYIGG